MHVPVIPICSTSSDSLYLLKPRCVFLSQCVRAHVFVRLWWSKPVLHNTIEISNLIATTRMSDLSSFLPGDP